MWATVKRALAFALFAMMPVFFFLHLGPGIWDDFMLQRSGLEPAQGARVYSAWCKPAQVVFSNCDVRIEVEGRKESVRLEFTAMAGYLGKYQPAALRSVADPERLTSSLNIEALRSRMIAFALLFGGTLWMFGFMVWVNVRDRVKARMESNTASSHVVVASSPVASAHRRTGSVVRAGAFGRRPR